MKNKKERNTHTKNEIIIYKDYAEIVLYNKNSEEVCRTIIDVEDVVKCKDYKWHKKQSNKEGKSYAKNLKVGPLHRYVLNDDSYPLKEIDHINGNSLDNRKENLRVTSHLKNSYNSRKKKNNKSGIIGVSWLSRSLKWRAYIFINKKQIYLGLFMNKEEALIARLKAELKYFGEDYSPQRDLFTKYNIK